jgi:hypothetical protein
MASKTNYARMATKPPQITRDIRVLPQRAVENLLAATSLKEQLIIAAPTEYRLTSDLPYAWLVLTTKHIALCNTHRSRGIYAINTLDKLADVKITLSGKQSVVYLNFSAGAGPNLMVPLKLSIPQAEIDELREVLRAALLAKMPEVIRSEEPDTSSPFGGDSTSWDPWGRESEAVTFLWLDGWDSKTFLGWFWLPLFEFAAQPCSGRLAIVAKQPGKYISRGERSDEPIDRLNARQHPIPNPDWFQLGDLVPFIHQGRV